MVRRWSPRANRALCEAVGVEETIAIKFLVAGSGKRASAETSTRLTSDTKDMDTGIDMEL